MSSICGIYKRAGAEAGEEEISLMVQRLNYWGADYTDSIVLDNTGFGHLMLYNTPESLHEQLPFYDKKAGLLIGADARIDNREELMQKLDLSSTPGLSDSQLILECFKTYNKRCVEHLVGAFAFAIWDKNKNELFCARDHIGFKPFHYYLDNQQFIFGTEKKHIVHHPGVDTTINERYIADALSTLKSANTETFYKFILKLPPAHYLVVTPESVYTKRYWDLNPNFELKLNSEEEYIEQFIEKMNEAVRCRLRSAYETGAELSGGIDSSAVTGFAAQYAELQSFSHTLPDWAMDKHFPYEDERKFIKQVNDFCKIKKHHFITGEEKGILTSLKEGVRLHDGILQSNLSLVSDALYERAQKQNVRTLLSGFGGDELVSYKGGGLFQELIYHHQYLKLIKELRYQQNKLKAIKNTAGSILAAYQYKIKKLSGNPPVYKTPKWAHDIYEALFLDSKFFEAQNLSERFYQNKKLPNDPDIRMRQYRRFHYSYFPARLENCYIAAQSRKIEYRYPLLDKRLLEFYLSLPPEMKVKKGWGRYILRKSMEGLLPHDIQWRNDKVGNTVPGVNIRLNKDYEKIKELIQRGRKSDIKHYIDYEKALEMLDKIAHRDKKQKGRILPQSLFGAVMTLLYQLDE
ncbi:MAG: asparagine synthase-related protein [Bacteroidales bacterium]